ncbi:ParB/RepB/Spo0J family partition protein [Conchiformibius steedae]|nr:ParB/RepB/Spo0J family partition protein [Conchiformibius steedae]
MTAYLNALDILGTGVDALFGGNQTTLTVVPLSDIQVKEQIRKHFEDETNSLSELAESIKQRGVLQPILLRPAPNGSGYELIAGERRFRAAQLAGLSSIPAHIKNLSDEEAEDAQLAENIQRKNLTQQEEALKIQRDLDKLGSVEAVLAKHNKSRAWLSKMLGLLNLPEQAQRLVQENISADLEVINLVKTVEKQDSLAAKQLVDDLKQTRGQADARAKAKAVKERVKPKKKIRSVAPETDDFNQWLHHWQTEIAAGRQTAADMLNTVSETELARLADVLMPHFVRGQSEAALSHHVAKQFAAKVFAEQGLGQLALWVFLQGVEKRNHLDWADLFALWQQKI